MPDAAGVLFNGIIMVTGERDTGKTSFTLECGAKPESMVFLDNDLKTSEVVRQLAEEKHAFHDYINLTKLRKGLTELKFYNACMEKVEKIPSGLDAIVWDNFSPFEDTIHPMVCANPNVWRTAWSPKGDIKGAQQWQSSFVATEQVLDILREKAKLVFIVYHLKNLNLSGVKTEKLVPAGKRVVPEKANLAVWLRMNDRGGGVPNGLILKRFNKVVVTASGAIDIVNILPRKMVPCTWDEIRKYWADPFGEKSPTKDQIPNAFELSILDGHLTPDQRKSFELMLQYGKKDEEEAALEAAGEVADQIKAYKTANPNATPGQIKEALTLDMTVPAIIKILTEK